MTIDFSRSRSCPALLVAGAASGQGKTTVAAALARLHARQGRRVRVFKCGPDFLDPGWLALAAGSPVHSLDLWMTGAPDCAARLWQAAGDADLLIVEGVMGLFDGAPSAADLAQRFGLPVLAVVSAAAMAGTFGALAFGLQHYRADLPWAGVLANRVASERHASMLRDGLCEPEHWLGALASNPAFALPERHLGLVAAAEMADGLARIDAAADALADTPLGRMTPDDLQRWSVTFHAPTDTGEAAACPPLLQGTTVAVARDAAFCFIYPANLDCLRALGAQLVFFSPLEDAQLPLCDAVWLPGGYPELHVARLAANRGLVDSLRRHVEAGRPLWAECGGMMPLFEHLRTADGQEHPTWGLLPGRTVMQPRLAALGPQQMQLGEQALRGHTFHYSTCETPLEASAWTAPPPRTGGGAARKGEAVFARGSLRASYFHAWFPSAPRAAAALFQPAGDDK